MYWKLIICISVAAILIVVAKWLLDSRDYGELLRFSRDKKPVVTKSTDDLFGTKAEKTDWKDGFWLGLMPNEDTPSLKIFAGVAPLTGIFVVLIGISIFMMIMKKRKNKPGKIKVNTNANLI